MVRQHFSLILMDKFFKNDVLETLRKYPVVMMLNRLCTKSITLPTTDLHVKKGTDILISVLGLHMDSDIWPDPERFDPERFSPENIAKRHPYSYIPFGEGPYVFHFFCSL